MSQHNVLTQTLTLVITPDFDNALPIIVIFFVGFHGRVIILSLVRKNEARKHAGCDEIAKISALKAKTSKFAEAAFFEGQKVVGGTVGVYNLLKKDFTDVS